MSKFPVSIRDCSGRTTWLGSEQQTIEFHAPTTFEMSLALSRKQGCGYTKELAPMKKDQVDLENAFVWIPDSKTPSFDTVWGGKRLVSWKSDWQVF
jgi:hypothetical protein